MRRNEKILIIEDDPIIERELSIVLTNNQYEVHLIQNYTDILQKIHMESIDLVLLDINLVDCKVDGFVLCSEIRSKSKVPIIFVTSRIAIEDEIQGLMLGGDDYITKPYNTSVLLLKIKAILKRYNQNEQCSELYYKEVTLSLAKSLVIYQEKNVELTKNEIKILHYLFLHRERIVSRLELIEYLWNNQLYIDDNALSLNMSRIRKKLQNIGLNDFIQTKYRQGYII